MNEIGIDEQNKIEILSALILAEEALKTSVPMMAHYPEPVARHKAALEKVSKELQKLL